MSLHTMRSGSGVPRVAYLHGLLGQGKNLATLAKAVLAASGQDVSGIAAE